MQSAVRSNYLHSDAFLLRSQQFLSPALTERLMTMDDPTFAEGTFETNLWTAPDCNYRELLRKLKQTVNGHGGDLNQTSFYLDTKGADSFLLTAATKGYLSAQQDMPIESPADAIYHHWKRNNFDRDAIHLFGLGCGDGIHEVRLVEAILQRMPETHIHLYLLDISPFLVNTAYHIATQAFERKKNVSIKQIQGNFENLNTYKPITQLALSCSQMVVLTMFGYTLGNLTSEQLFIHNALRALPKNTLFLSDVLICNWNTDDPEIIQQKDPRLTGKANLQKETDHFDAPETLEFLRNPIWQYREGVKKIEFSQKLDHTTCIPGSYAVVIYATVDDSVEFTMFRIKRYIPAKFADMLLKEGWGSVRGFPYGRATNPMMLYLAYKF